MSNNTRRSRDIIVKYTLNNKTHIFFTSNVSFKTFEGEEPLRIAWIWIIQSQATKWLLTETHLKLPALPHMHKIKSWSCVRALWLQDGWRSHMQQCSLIHLTHGSCQNKFDKTRLCCFFYITNKWSYSKNCRDRCFRWDGSHHGNMYLCWLEQGSEWLR